MSAWVMVQCKQCGHKEEVDLDDVEKLGDPLCPTCLTVMRQPGVGDGSCENPGCDAYATHKVMVSVDLPGDDTRSYCYICYEAFVVGLQHARKVLLHQFAADGTVRTRAVRVAIEQADLLIEEDLPHDE